MGRFLRWFGAIGFVAVASVAGSTVQAVTVTDTTVADFNAGTLGACAVAEVLDGEVILTPTEGSEFFGTSLPAGWLLRDWHSPAGVNTSSVGSGVLLANSVRINRDPLGGPAPYAPDRSLEFVATFGAAQHQHVGFGGGDQTGSGEVFNGPPWAMFSTTNQTSNVLARVHNGSGTFTDVPVDVIDELPHRYRIDWSASQVDFFIDDNPVQTDAVNPITVNMRPAISDFEAEMTPIAIEVDWIRMSPYASPCVYASAVIDGGNVAADWTTLIENARLPVGTGVIFETRTGNVSSPDPSWSPFAAVGMGGALASPNGRYLQYRATLSTTDLDQTAELEDVSVSYTACTPVSEICGNAIDDDCDGSDLACTPTETPTFTPVPPTLTATPTFTPLPTLTDTPTFTPVPPTPTNTRTATPGLCGNSNVDPGEQCDDGNTDNGDCCNATCHFEPGGSSCNDHKTCTTGETCNTFGQCVGFTACNTSLTCDICGSKCTLQAAVCKCG